MVVHQNVLSIMDGTQILGINIHFTIDILIWYIIIHCIQFLAGFSSFTSSAFCHAVSFPSTFARNSNPCSPLCDEMGVLIKISVFCSPRKQLHFKDTSCPFYRQKRTKLYNTKPCGPVPSYV